MENTRNLVFCVVIGLLGLSLIDAVPVFTGDARADFQRSKLTPRDIASYHKFNNTDQVNVIPWMAEHGRRSGVDIDAIRMVYDDIHDTMYVGVECAAICGDVDGDGNPGGVDPSAPLDAQGASTLGTDTKDMCSSEQLSLMFWNNVPEDFVPIQAGQSPYFFFPTMVVGVEYFECIYSASKGQKFSAYECPIDPTCAWPYPKLNPTAPCVNDTRRKVASPGTRNTGVYSSRELSTEWISNPAYRPVGPVEMFTRYPNISHPHIEFKLTNFSNYPQFDFIPGATKMRFALQGAAGSSADKNGEDLVRTEIWELKWDCDHWPGGDKTYDACGVCGGDNTTCWDCDHIPNGPKRYDACGVCDGDNTTCWDCDHTPNGPKRYDACGVCDGDNQTCWDCDHIPNGPKRYDACGVCDGDNQTCWDCAHIPNGPARYDACGVCDGDNTTCWDCDHIPNGPKRYDACGVCDGNNQTCWDCDHIPNGPKRYDACGVCDGDNQTCWDCDHTPNGPKRYDACGVCDGNNQTCWDCAHTPNGPKRYDACGVCNGDNTTCWDCDHIPNGPKRYDACGVCDGDNQTCWDCDHIPNGPKRYDACGVCDGDNTTCWDCDHTPNGPKRYDACGVCDGDNTTCWDCNHIPGGSARYDACGVCDGDNQTCWDCDHIPNGDKVYDVCGVCGGNNQTCWDCFHIPNGLAVYDRHGICGGNGTADCFDDPYGVAVYDKCGVCDGDESTCTCYRYLGYESPYLCYALLRWSIAASRVKITDTLDILYAIKHELPYYDYKSEVLPLSQYIDTLHDFCDECLDNFDYAQVWFADHVAGNCVGVDCEELDKHDFSWSL